MSANSKWREDHVNEFACTAFSKEPLKMNRHWMGGSRSKVAQDRAKSIEVKQRAFFEAQKRGHNTPLRVASAPDDTFSPHLSRDFMVLTTNIDIDCATPVNPQNQSAKKRKERDSPDQKAPEVQQPQPLKLQSGHLMSASTAQSSPLQRIKERCDDFKKPKRLQAARTPTLHASVPIPSPVVGHKSTAHFISALFSLSIMFDFCLPSLQIVKFDILSRSTLGLLALFLRHG